MKQESEDELMDFVEDLEIKETEGKDFVYNLCTLFRFMTCESTNPLIVIHSILYFRQ